jgi:cell division protein FtsL
MEQTNQKKPAGRKKPLIQARPGGGKRSSGQKTPNGKNAAGSQKTANGRTKPNGQKAPEGQMQKAVRRKPVRLIGKVFDFLFYAIIVVAMLAVALFWLPKLEALVTAAVIFLISAGMIIHVSFSSVQKQMIHEAPYHEINYKIFSPFATRRPITRSTTRSSRPSRWCSPSPRSAIC